MNPPVLVYVVDHSRSAAVAAAMPRMMEALGRQLAEHLAPTWGRVVPALQYGGKAPAGASQIVLLEETDQADALGYHDETPEGVPYARVFLKPILSRWGTLYNSPNSLSVTLSHELLELVGDPSANLWADGPGGLSYALELCDPCESDAYAIDDVFVSNFVFPGYFDPQGGPNVRLDYMGVIEKPFGVRPGGYQIRRSHGSSTDNVWGQRYPEWKRASKAHKEAKRSGARSA